MLILYVPVIGFSVLLGWVFLVWTRNKQMTKSLCSASCVARTHPILGQALYHWASAILYWSLCVYLVKHEDSYTKQKYFVCLTYLHLWPDHWEHSLSHGTQEIMMEPLLYSTCCIYWQNKITQNKNILLINLPTTLTWSLRALSEPWKSRNNDGATSLFNLLYLLTFYKHKRKYFAY